MGDISNYVKRDIYAFSIGQFLEGHSVSKVVQHYH